MKNLVKCSAWAAATSACLALSPLWAQTASGNEAHLLSEVTINARNLESPGLLLPAQELSGAALAQRQAATLGETLFQLHFSATHR